MTYFSALSIPGSLKTVATSRDSVRPRLHAADYISAAVAASTRRAYQGDVRDFFSWGGSIPCSPQTIVEYVVDRAGHHSVITIARRLVGIGRAHTSQGLLDPSKSELVRTVLRGLRRTNGVSQRQAVPVLREDIFEILNKMHGIRGVRDRAMVLLGFAAALRRSELVALDVEDLHLESDGLLVNLRRSKTDQLGRGRKVAVPYGRTFACPVKAVRLWLNEADIRAGPIFRGINKAGRVSTSRLSDQSISLVVKKCVSTIGLAADKYSGHSLRAGLVTSAARAGASLPKIQEQTGHKSVAMLTRYIRDARLFENNASGLLL